MGLESLETCENCRNTGGQNMGHEIKTYSTTFVDNMVAIDTFRLFSQGLIKN